MRNHLLGVNAADAGQTFREDGLSLITPNHQFREVAVKQ
jgi:hypothetical protein